MIVNFFLKTLVATSLLYIHVIRKCHIAYLIKQTVCRGKICRASVLKKERKKIWSFLFRWLACRWNWRPWFFGKSLCSSTILDNRLTTFIEKWRHIVLFQIKAPLLSHKLIVSYPFNGKRHRIIITMTC